MGVEGIAMVSEVPGRTGEKPHLTADRGLSDRPSEDGLT